MSDGQPQGAANFKRRTWDKEFFARKARERAEHAQHAERAKDRVEAAHERAEHHEGIQNVPEAAQVWPIGRRGVGRRGVVSDVIL